MWPIRHAARAASYFERIHKSGRCIYVIASSPRRFFFLTEFQKSKTAANNPLRHSVGVGPDDLNWIIFPRDYRSGCDYQQRRRLQYFGDPVRSPAGCGLVPVHGSECGRIDGHSRPSLRRVTEIFESAARHALPETDQSDRTDRGTATGSHLFTSRGTGTPTAPAAGRR